MAGRTVSDTLRRGVSVRVMGVEYVHLCLPDGDDLYLTADGAPFAAQLLPESFWTDEAWSAANRTRLKGTSAVYRIRTKPACGRSKDIVLKWNRMGQDIPGATRVDDAMTAEFNSPFEEFALTLELRAARGGAPHRLLTHKPLAIYVPGERVEPERLGRRLDRLEAKQLAHPEIQLHMHRNYAVIYEWIKGIDALQARAEGRIGGDELSELVRRVAGDLDGKGFVVRDNKAEHVIVRPDETGRLLADREGRTLYAYVDFELLERTPEHEREIRAAKRRAYLVKQAHRFEATAGFPTHLRPVKILGMDYVYGRSESTQGRLWVVGRDPGLFDYFLPEKWRKTPRKELSVASDVFHTVTKDNIHLVWRVSHVGRQPDADPFKDDEKRILDHGYNSPFEEVALALRLSRRGVGTIYPRAIYMTGKGTDIPSSFFDGRRYESHRRICTPDGAPVLQRGRDYIIIWGYWNGPDELLAARDNPPYVSINALQAHRQGLLSHTTYLRLIRRSKERMAAVGVEDLNLRGSHLLLSLMQGERLAMDADGLPSVLICNFELLRCRNAGGG